MKGLRALTPEQRRELLRSYGALVGDSFGCLLG